MTTREGRLARALADRALVDTNFWSFGQQLGRRTHGHGIFQYPAMMVPEMVEALLAVLKPFMPTDRVPRLLDPFAGSGTVLTEAMPFGFAARGVDINPFAILLCRAKTGPYRMSTATAALDQVTRMTAHRRKVRFDVPDRVITWYEPGAAADLMRLRRAIRTIDDRNVRCIFWCVLAETARITSNSRTSTFKLHVRSKADIDSRVLNVTTAFAELAARALRDLAAHRSRLQQAKLLSGNSYRHPIKLDHADVRTLRTPPTARLADLLVTSPPYGDNRSTVPYGQHSWLPGSWVDICDAADGLVGAVNPYAIDTDSLGGRSNRRDRVATTLAGRSASFDNIAALLEDEPADRLERVSRFVSDLDDGLDPILASVAPNAPMVWVMGDRRVGGNDIPTTAILRELLEARGATWETTLSRDLPVNRKRMALRNSVAETMRRESIVVMRAPANSPVAVNDARPRARSSVAAHASRP